jgi:hypothetical protein
MNSNSITSDDNIGSQKTSARPVSDPSFGSVDNVDMNRYSNNLIKAVSVVDNGVASPSSIRKTKNQIYYYLQETAKANGLIITEDTFRTTFQALLLGLATTGPHLECLRTKQILRFHSTTSIIPFL